jgi:hypothetical protein
MGDVMGVVNEMRVSGREFAGDCAVASRGTLRL